MAWSLDDGSDLMELLAGTREMRDGAKRAMEAVGRIRDRHRRDATVPALLREAHIEDEARHVTQEADEMERDAEVVHRMFEGGATT